MARRPLPFAWLAVAILLPLLVLAVLAWLGTNAQLRGAWNTAKDEAEVLATGIAMDFPVKMNRHVKTVPVYPDPPIPGPGAPIEGDPLSGDNVTALRKLRDDPAAGLSPAGLPRRALAAAKLLDHVLINNRADAEIAIHVATQEAPSVLTERILDEAEKHVRGLSTDARAEWKRGNRIRQIVDSHPEINRKGWLAHNGNVIWLTGDSIRYIDKKGMETTLDAFSSRLPRWAALRVSSEGSPFVGVEQGALIARAILPDRAGLEVGLVAVRKDLIESSARTQARWTLALLSFAIAIAALGLWLIHRVLDRERRLNAMKSDFVASVSHELRAPIASIRLMADALESGKIERHTATEFHRLISREGSRLSTLIENVLDFARIEQGHKQWHPEETDLLRLVTDTVALMEPLAREKGIRLVATDMPDQATANVDPGAIQQAIVNLLDNAIKFSPLDSEVEVQLASSNDSWSITITDHGPGIPTTEQQRIFEKFHRLGNELRRETQGTGIGLSLVKAIAEAHGGTISIRSELSKGSTFTLTLPNHYNPQL